MDEKKFGDVVVELRKKKGFTQQELANKLNITDKAVSKWERGLAYPDITSISRLAKVLGVESSYLIDLCKSDDNPYKSSDVRMIFDLICKAMGIAMSVGVVSLNILEQIDVRSSLIMIGIGLFFISISVLSNTKVD